MAVVINSFFTGQCGRERKFTDDMIGGGMIDKIRAQKGCRRYEYFVPMYGGGIIQAMTGSVREAKRVLAGQRGGAA